jgi:putative spermidine/putrescine transport system substrate-binding protein
MGPAPISRRDLIRSSLALTAGAAVLGRRGIGAAQAKPSSIVVTSYGGIWEKAVKENFAACFKDKTGVEARVLIGTPTEWHAKILANRSNPPINAIVGVDYDTFKGIETGVFEKIPPEKVPNLKDIPKVFYETYDGYAVTLDWGAFGLLYNKKKIPSPPTSWVEFFDRAVKGEFGKKVSLPSINSPVGGHTLWTWAHLFGGGVDNVDPAFKKMKEIAPYNVKNWVGMPEPLQLIESGEVDIVVYPDGRAWAFIDGGKDWAGYVNPKPGGYLAPVQIGVVKNSPEITWEYLNCALAPGPQLGFAKLLRGYGVSNAKVVLPDDLKQRVTPWDQALFPPLKVIAKKMPEWLERWNKEVGR